jgi:hypothetical protein
VTSGVTFLGWDQDEKMIAAAMAADKIIYECTKACPKDFRNCTKCDGCIAGL